ncbi:hypothetical protein LCGC14_0231390 [marine sediment metagenome]|uniref:Uncharacterized protein n=1 Tax=marine sediment metagenome TaxID=412755 RepID=A0A0F9UR99_9ZZZZ
MKLSNTQLLFLEDHGRPFFSRWTREERTARALERKGLIVINDVGWWDGRQQYRYDVTDAGLAAVASH